MFFQIIESSSSGNCAVFRWNEKYFLIDAGIGVRKLHSHLAQLGLEIDAISGVFITHDHSDHCQTLKSLSREKFKVFSNRATFETVCSRYEKARLLNWTLFENGIKFSFEGLEITPFSVPHDASDTVGYSFCMDGKNLVWITDIGKPTILATEMAKNADILVLESNYCPKMLEKSKRSFGLKNRISNSHGHLSNEDAISLLKNFKEKIPEKIFLAHVSKECNEVSHIRDMLAENLPENIFSRIEIVNPFGESSSPFGEL